MTAPSTGSLHHHPPLTPAGVLLHGRWAAPLVAVAGLLLLLVWHQCRALAWTLLAATAARPLLEWAIKELVDRPRPDLDRLVPGNGPSFPSGHVMAAVAIWGLLPPVVALLTGRRSAWWWSVGISATVITAVAFSRVYLGVHWLTDVIGALLLGALYLLAVEALLEWHHRRRPCRAMDIAEGHAQPSDSRWHPSQSTRRNSS